MRERLERLGVGGVTARTFHSAALRQLHRLGTPPERIMASKALLLRQLGNSLPPPYKFRPAGDLATEVEWAKNRRLTPATYLGGLGEHEPPIPPDLMFRIFRGYEVEKEERGFVDFEDLLESTIRLFDEDPGALAEVRSYFNAFTVDEYQDVNLLQQTLLDRWLGDRDELCAVGDDYQSIYAFTGATPDYLLGLPRRFAERDCDQARGQLSLVARGARTGESHRPLTRRCGEDPPRNAPRRARAGDTRAFAAREAETAFVVDRIRALAGGRRRARGRSPCCVARTRGWPTSRSRSTRREIPFQGAALLAREAARQLLKQLRKRDTTEVAVAVRTLARDAGWRERLPEKLGEREMVRQSDLGRIVRLAAEFDDGERTTRDFIADLEERFSSSGCRPAGRPPTDPARCEGSRVRRSLHPAARGEGAADQAGQEAARDRGGATAVLRRPDAGEASPRAVVGRQAEPVPRRARIAAAPARKRARPSPTIRCMRH